MFLSKSHHTHLSVVIDIDSDTVGVGLTALSADKSPELLLNLRASHERRPVKTVLRELLSRLQKEGPSIVADVWRKGASRHIDHIVVALASPHVNSKLVTKVNQDIVDEGEGDLLEKEVVSLLVNGYSVDPALWNKNHASWEADFLLSFCQPQFKKDIEEEIMHAFGTKRGILFKSAVSIYSALLPRTLTRLGTSAVVRASGLVTDIALYENGRMKKFLSAPLGISHLLGNLIKQTNMSRVLARSTLISVAEGALLPERFEMFSNTLNNYSHEWSDVWGKEFGDIKPDHIILLGEQLDDAVMKNVFRLSIPNIKITSIHDERLFSRQTGERSRGVSDEVLSTLALYSNSLL